MKFIIAPAKTLNTEATNYLTPTEPTFIETSKTIISHLQSFSKSDLKKGMKIRNKLLDQTYDNIQHFEEATPTQAISTYNGMVYKQLHLDAYTPERLNYLQTHVVILDALYGLLLPSDMIKPYRLDFKMSIGLDLYDIWRPLINLTNDLIINIASGEFSSLIKQPMVTVLFKEERNNSYKTIGTYAKKARGVFLDYCIQHQINTIDAIKAFNQLHYTFNPSLSDASTIVFTRPNQKNNK